MFHSDYFVRLNLKQLAKKKCDCNQTFEWVPTPGHFFPKMQNFTVIMSKWEKPITSYIMGIHRYLYIIAFSEFLVQILIFFE